MGWIEALLLGYGRRGTVGLPWRATCSSATGYSKENGRRAHESGRMFVRGHGFMRLRGSGSAGL